MKEMAGRLQLPLRENLSIFIRSARRMSIRSIQNGAPRRLGHHYAQTGIVKRTAGQRSEPEAGTRSIFSRKRS